MGTRVLVVEDEPLSALDLVDMLTEGGFQVLGPVSLVSDALRLICSEGCDVAVLDVNLGRESAEPIAIHMRERGIPFLVLSGYSRAQHPPGFNGAPSLAKPVSSTDLVREVSRLKPRT
jgi:DNA-binding response OmpR family regulator